MDALPSWLICVDSTVSEMIGDSLNCDVSGRSFVAVATFSSAIALFCVINSAGSDIPACSLTSGKLASIFIISCRDAMEAVVEETVGDRSRSISTD